MKTVFIYALIDPRNDQIRYIGKSWNPRVRLNSHMSDRLRSHKASWLKALTRLGLRPTAMVLEDVPESEWEAAERWWIAYMRSLGCRLTNLASGGSGGKAVSEETREKMRVSARRRRCPCSSERRAKISATQKGRVMPESRRLKLSAASLGKPLSKAQREAIRRGMLARSRERGTLSLRQVRMATIRGAKHVANLLFGRATRGRKRPPFSLEWKAAMRAPKGPMTKEHRLRISLALRRKHALCCLQDAGNLIAS